MADRYAFAGQFYELLSRAYSGNAIPKCRDKMFDLLKPGDKVIFGGVGYGWDAIRAAQLGADVTIVEMSHTMITKFHKTVKKAGAEGLKLRAVESDILKFEEFGKYDMVVANFFLNVFDHPTMIKIFTHMIKLGKPKAKIVVGDFALPSGNFLARLLKNIYYYIPAVTFFVITRNAFHPIYDYPGEMKALGVDVREKRFVSLLGIDFYWSVLGEKRA
jgi:hypothetical protein